MGVFLTARTVQILASFRQLAVFCTTDICSIPFSLRRPKVLSAGTALFSIQGLTTAVAFRILAVPIDVWLSFLFAVPCTDGAEPGPRVCFCRVDGLGLCPPRPFACADPANLFVQAVVTPDPKLFRIARHFE